MLKKLAIIAVPILLVGGGYMHLKNKTAAQAAEMAAFQIEKAEITKGNIEESISSSGKIQSASLKEVKINKKGTIEEVYVKDGVVIDKGGKLIKLNNVEGSSNISQKEFDIVSLQNDIRKQRDKAAKLTIRAPFSGIVSGIKAKAGEDISSGGELLTLTDKSKLSVVVKYSKLIAEKIEVGDTAKATVLSNLYTTNGKVTKVSKSGAGSENGQLMYEVEVEFSNSGAIVEDLDVQVSVLKNGASYKSVGNGKTKWAKKEIIKPELGGKIKSIKVDEAEPVKEGQILAVLTNDDHMDSIKMNERRLSSLRDSFAQDKKAYDNTIYAPITGTVIDLNVVSGENVDSGTTIAKIADLDNFQVTIPIDELDILNVNVGQKAEIRVKAIEKNFIGTVSKVFKVGKDVGGSTKYDVVIDIEKNELFKDIRIGMNATINLKLNSKDNTLLAPIDYVSLNGDKYIIKKEDGNGMPVEIEVEVGLMSSKYVEVKGDIKEGDVIVK